MDRIRPTKEIPFSNAAPGNYGNEPTSTTTLSASSSEQQEMDSGKTSSKTRSRTATLRPVPSTQIHMDFGAAVRHRSLPLTRCDRCGLEFGSSSIVLHRQTCRGSASRRKRTKPGRQAKGTPTSADVSEECGKKEAIAVTTTLDSPSLEQVAGVRVFGEACQFCGERFSRHSLQLHVRKCRKKNRAYTVEESRREGKVPSGRKSTTVGAVPESSVAGAVEVQTGEVSRTLPQQLKLLQSRPQTRSLDHSTLLEKGLTLPSIDGGSTLTRCGTCRELIASGELFVHKKTCRPSPRTVTRGEITFPVLTNRSGMTTGDNRLPQNPQVAEAAYLHRRPPAVVCYICGREYGTKSILIHEPQCLKRFETENRKLPVNERRPLPRKSIMHTAKAPQQHKEATGATCIVEQCGNREVLLATAEDYFQYCYQEWEKDLVPCKKCGRKFAPERHVKHAPRCKAKPLPDLAQT
jgi:hypothetical protein